ncbi:MAG: hypothetical protein KDE35_18465 [Geminicoccaceae bacterium]|nr:hypothetical protein [Geminicoccaceae bacterium]
MMKLPRILEVTPIEAGRLSIVWSNRARSTVDIRERIARLDHFAPLADETLFATARAAMGGRVVAWGDVLDEDGEGPIDVGADQLWRWAAEQAGEAMPHAAWKAWRERHGFAVATAAEVLGISRRMAAYYDSGAWPIPKTVMLACEGYDARRADREPTPEAEPA